MNNLIVKTRIKVVGPHGQISLGKKFAGRQVLIEEREPGVWIIRTLLVIPDNESWLHEPQAKLDLQEALAWSASHPPQESDLDATSERLNSRKQRKLRPARPQ